MLSSGGSSAPSLDGSIWWRSHAAFSSPATECAIHLAFRHSSFVIAGRSPRIAWISSFTTMAARLGRTPNLKCAAASAQAQLAPRISPGTKEPRTGPRFRPTRNSPPASSNTTAHSRFRKVRRAASSFFPATRDRRRLAGRVRPGSQMARLLYGSDSAIRRARSP